MLNVKLAPMKQRKDNPIPSRQIKGRPHPGTVKAESAFDIWLQRSLHKLFDEVANEPVPEELIRLIEEDRRK